MSDPKFIAERLWQPHLDAVRAMATAGDYEGIRRLIGSVSLDIAKTAHSQASGDVECVKLAAFIKASPENAEIPGRFHLGWVSAADRDRIVAALSRQAPQPADMPSGEWRRDYENAPSEAYDFFLVRQTGLHPGTGKPFIPAIVQQIDGQLFAPDNELDPLIFGHGQPKPDWHDAGLEWRHFPADWLLAAAPSAQGKA